MSNHEILDQLTKPTIAVDVMGGDFGPKEIFPAVKNVLNSHDCNIILVGEENELNRFFETLTEKEKQSISLVPSYNDILMEEEAASAVKNKPNSSIVICSKLVADGKAHAMVGAGNTGAMMASAVLNMGRLKGVKRPGIAVPVPVPSSVYEPDSHAFQIMIDGGSTVDCEPKWLYQFAVMAKAYTQHRLHIEHPTIGLLSNGEEPGKGDELRKKTFDLLKDMEGFIGNCEGRDLTTGSPNIVVTDGFTGNIALKTMEGTYRSVAKLIMATLTSSEEIVLQAEPLFGPLMEAADKVHPDKVGGCVLLGVDGICVITHGSSNAEAFSNAIAVAYECVETDVVESIRSAIAEI